MVPFTIEQRVGGLIEARVWSLPDLQEAERYAAGLAAALARVAPTNDPVLCADHRPVAIYRPEVADRLSALFIVMNARLGRVAVLVSSSNATLAMQLERIVREARYRSRRVFYDPAQAAEFLTPALSGAASDRARAFLSEWASPPPAR